MKKLLNLSAVIALISLAGPMITKAMPVHSMNVKADTTIDPKKGPFTVNLDKHSEIMAKVQGMIKNGKIRILKLSDTDTTLDLSKHPELVKAIIKNPSNWPIILKAYDYENALSPVAKNKQVIRDILAYLVNNKIVESRTDVNSFMLTAKSFTVNNKTLPESMHTELKAKYIKSDDYVVYYGNSEKKGNGIFQRRDNL
ncbi:MAG TPA: hypothetical protein VG367_19915 [Mucilaginibacter sp.]|jgi:hypothetical protein|nr:hypothetical protein [Mucilaginibacter sp.]